MATADTTRSTSAQTTDRRPSLVQRLTTETKSALKTTEFYAYLLVLGLILIAGNQIEIEEGGTDYFAADKVWLYITLLTIGYMISRGLAKSGSRDPYWGERGDRNLDQ